jgi:hypothetical protein
MALGDNPARNFFLMCDPVLATLDVSYLSISHLSFAYTFHVKRAQYAMFK